MKDNINYIKFYMLPYLARLLMTDDFVKEFCSKKVRNCIILNKILNVINRKIKRIKKNNRTKSKLKTFSLLNEIRNFEPNEKIKVLNKGSRNYNLRRQKFTHIPPYMVYPGELDMMVKENYDLLIKVKAVF